MKRGAETHCAGAALAAASDTKVLLRSTRLVCRRRASAAALTVAVAVARACRLFSKAARLRSKNAVPSKQPVVRAASALSCCRISARAESLRALFLEMLGCVCGELHSAFCISHATSHVYTCILNLRIIHGIRGSIIHRRQRNNRCSSVCIC